MILFDRKIDFIDVLEGGRNAVRGCGKNLQARCGLMQAVRHAVAVGEPRRRKRGGPQPAGRTQTDPGPQFAGPSLAALAPWDTSPLGGPFATAKARPRPPDPLNRLIPQPPELSSASVRTWLGSAFLSLPRPSPAQHQISKRDPGAVSPEPCPQKRVPRSVSPAACHRNGSWPAHHNRVGQGWGDFAGAGCAGAGSAGAFVDFPRLPKYVLMPST